MRSLYWLPHDLMGSLMKTRNTGTGTGAGDLGRGAFAADFPKPFFQLFVDLRLL